MNDYFNSKEVDTGANKNVRNSRGDTFNDDYWSSHERKKLPSEFYTKNGKLRSSKTFNKLGNNRAKYGFNQAADKGPLHRKGSLNREL